MFYLSVLYVIVGCGLTDCFFSFNCVASFVCISYNIYCMLLFNMGKNCVSFLYISAKELSH